MLIEPADWMYFTGRAAILVVALIAFAVAFGRWRRAGARDMQRLFLELDESRGHAREMTDLTKHRTEKDTAKQAWKTGGRWRRGVPATCSADTNCLADGAQWSSQANFQQRCERKRQ